jgi:hypothetical protein
MVAAKHHIVQGPEDHWQKGKTFDNRDNSSGRQHDSMAMIIPRAKVKHSNSSSHGRGPRGGYHSDDDFFTQDEVSGNLMGLFAVT